MGKLKGEHDRLIGVLWQIICYACAVGGNLLIAFGPHRAGTLNFYVLIGVGLVGMALWIHGRRFPGSGRNRVKHPLAGAIGFWAFGLIVVIVFWIVELNRG